MTGVQTCALPISEVLADQVILGKENILDRVRRQETVLDVEERRQTVLRSPPADEVEVASVHLACARVSDAQLDAFEEFVHTSATKYEGMTLADTVRTDEAFHVKLAELSGNREMRELIESINARIRFVRGIDIMRRIPVFVDEHAGIMAALRARDAMRCEKLMRGHIECRLDQIVDVVKEGVVHIYVAPQLAAKPVTATRPPRKTA